MKKEKSDSSYIQEASALIDSVRGKPLSLEERKKSAVELAAYMQREANRIMTSKEKNEQRKLAELMKDPAGKAFTTYMADQCFRSDSKRRIADQLIHLLDVFGVPQYLPFFERMGLVAFKLFGKLLPSLFVPASMFFLRKETARVILPGEKKELAEHIKKRTQEGVRLNLNHLGEAILSEQEAKDRLQLYLDDLANPLINYISIKISTLFSQINLLAWEYSVDKIAEKLRLLYRAAMQHPHVKPDGTKEYKFVNLDMEEYRDLHLTCDVFMKVLNEGEFHSLSAGIVLQAYLPDSFNLQKKLTERAKERVKNGGAPLKLRIVKGANLAMEQVEASLRTWPQAPYTCKMEVDANYKKMVMFGCLPENARAMHLGIASHNMFDIAFALLLRSEYQVEPYTTFEMLEGMADHIRRVVQSLTGDILLYCAVAKKEDFRFAIAYLIRRLDENTGTENFLRHVFGLRPGSATWDGQVALFRQSCNEVDKIYLHPRRQQNRGQVPNEIPSTTPFDNEADTDFSLPQNRSWTEKITLKYSKYKPPAVPIVINGKEILSNQNGVAFDPSFPQKPLFHYMLAESDHIELALKCAHAQEKRWAETPLKERAHLLFKAAQKFREKRDEFLGIMMIGSGKTIPESDPEISEAIDFLEYYCRQIDKLFAFNDLEWKSKGAILVAPPWNFPVAIPTGGIAAALITGNPVIFKPAPEAVLVGWHIVKTMWEAGIPKEVLQFVNCNDDPEGSLLIKDPRIHCVILTGATATAKKFLQMRPGLDLAAETGGKNAMIITDLSDRDLAVKDLLHSAFSHSGQKCSAASLAILERQVYDDPNFKRLLREAASSLKVGNAHDPTNKIGPLIKEPGEALMRGLTTLDENEEWLLEPKPDPHNSNLWTPGIKWGVKLGSFTQSTELFGPVLGIMRADNLEQAIEFANSTEYGLTAGLHSLDEREHEIWIEKIEAGNCYINRTMTGAIVRRQPFGGCKRSSFGNGSKAGGPNYLREFMTCKQIGLPQEKQPVNEWVNSLTAFLENLHLSAEELGIWYASTSNYAYWWKRMRQKRDPTKVVGQDNFFFYVPRKGITLRLDSDDTPLDALRICAAALTCGCPLEISWTSNQMKHHIEWLDLVPLLRAVDESEADFLERVHTGLIKKIRVLKAPSHKLKEAAAKDACHIADSAVLANGRFELLHYLREVSLSIDYHRYGNLGTREGEIRKPIL